MRSLKIGLLTLGSLFLITANTIFSTGISFYIQTADQQTVQYLVFIGGLITVISGFVFIFAGSILAEIFEKIELVDNDSIKINNIFVWLIAFVPIIGGLIIMIEPITSAFIVIILNIVFLIIDKKNIEKNGIKTDSWFWIGLILIPVYLFLRAQYTKKYGYAIAWCVFYIIGIFIPLLK